ncbi:MAG: alpha/beta hydrolase, partial [Promethearchaeota archaeon]
MRAKSSASSYSGRNLFSDRKLIFLLVFLIIFIGTGLASLYTPHNIIFSLNNYTYTADGVKIAYDIYEPADNNMDEKKAVILGHGIAVNKEVLHLIAKDLASHGFIAITFDFRGHGISGGRLDTNMSQGGGDNRFNLENLKMDIMAIKWVLGNRSDVDIHDLGYVGYSMGGGAGFLMCYNDSDFKAMVGLAPVPDYFHTNTTRPGNLLIIIGKYDEAISYPDIMKVMVNKTGLDPHFIELGKVYGNFKSGTAAKLYVDNNSDHFILPYDPDTIINTRNWFLQALMNEDKEDNSLNDYYIEIGSLMISMITGFITLILFIGLILERVGVRKYVESSGNYNSDVSWGRFLIMFLPLTFVLSFIMMSASIPLLFVDLPFTSVYVSFIVAVALSGLVSFAIIFRNKKLTLAGEDYNFTGVLKRGLKNTSVENIFLGTFFGIVFYVIMIFTQNQILGIIPSLNRLQYTPIYFIYLFVPIHLIGTFIIPWLDAKLKLTESDTENESEREEFSSITEKLKSAKKGYYHPPKKSKTRKDPAI